MITCPNKATEEWKEFEKEHGYPRAYSLWVLAGERIPTRSEVISLDKGEKYSDIELKDTERYQVPVHITDFWDRYTDISKKKAELQQQGAQITNLGETGFNYLIPQRQQPYQQKIKITKPAIYELRNRVERTLSERGTEIGKAFELIRQAGTKTVAGTEKGKRGVQEKDRLQKLLKRGGAEVVGQPSGRRVEGGEHIAYLDKEKGIVTKVAKVELNNLEAYLRNITRHNIIFPDTAYKFLGFHISKGNISPVVEQRYIESDGSYDRIKVERYLKDLGFYPYHDGPVDFVNNDIGVGLRDIAPGNVIFHEGRPYFVDPQISYGKQVYDKLSKVSNEKLDKTVEAFLTDIGVEVKRLKDEGQDFAAMADTLRGVISVVEGKAGIDTLSEEAAHMFIDLLPVDSKLLKDILADAFSSGRWDDVYDQYKGDPQYQLPDGSVDEDKITKETAGKLVAEAMVGRFETKQAQKWWERLWEWVKGLFKGKNLDNYSMVAEDILSGNTKKLSKEKIAAINRASERGEIYYELRDEDRKRVEDIRDAKGTTDIQRSLIDALYLKPEGYDKLVESLGVKPHIPVVLIEDSHTYVDIYGETYESTTKRINGEFSPEQQEMYRLNREWGNAFDALLQGVTLGKQVHEIDTPLLPEKVKQDAYATLRAFVQEHTADGSIALTQVVVADPVSKVAGSIDLLLISPDGFARIVDLKTSIRPTVEGGKLTGTYTSKWEAKEGSVFTGTDIKLSKELQHAIQTGVYGKMLELQGIPVVSLHSLHLQIKTEGEQVTGYKNEGLIAHPPTDNEPYIDMVLPTAVDVNNPSVLQMKAPGYDYSKEPEYVDPVEAGEMKERSKKEFNRALDESPVAKHIAEEIVKVIGQREQYIKGLAQTKQEPAIQEKTIYQIGELKRDMMRSLKKGKYSDILNSWSNYTIEQCAKTSAYLSDPDKLDDPKFTAIAEQSKKFIQSYAYINSLVDQVHSTQIAKFNEAVGAVNQLRLSMEEAAFNWFIYKGKQMDTRYLDEEIENYVKGNPKDIGIMTRLFGAPSATSSIPLSLGFKTVSDALHRSTEAFSGFRDKATAIEKELHAVLGIKKYKDGMYDKITHKNGTFVRREGPAHLQKEAEAWKALQDDNGIYKEWRTDDTEEAYEYNKQLQGLREHYADLTRPENREGEPGAFYEFTDEFLKKREEFEKQNLYGRYVIQFQPDAVKDLRWTKVDDKYYEENPDGTQGRLLSDNERKGLAALEYRYKFYKPIEKKYTLKFDKEGVFTGKVIAIDGETQWVVKDQYKRLRDKKLERDWKAGDNIYKETDDLRDPKYVALMEDQSAEGRAWWKFYEGYMKNWDDLYSKLPAEKVEYLKGKMPVQASSLWRQFMDGDTPQTKMGVLGDKLGRMFNGTYVGERMVDEAGNIKQSISTGYSGSLRDQEHTDRLRRDLDNIDAAWAAKKATATKAQRAEYKKERSLKADELKAAESKLQPYQIEQDIVKSQIETAMKIETYNQISEIESNLLMIRETAAIKNQKKELAQTDAQGRSLFKKTIDDIGTSIKRALTGGDSNELARIDDMLKMVVYHSEEYPGSFWAKLEGLPITLSALNLFLFNPPVSMGVYSMMKAIHLKEAMVGQFFNYKNFARAQSLLAKAIPEYLSNQAVIASGGEGKKYASKVEAWIAKTQAFTKGLSDDSGLKQLLLLEHYTEWTGVAHGALAIGLHTPIPGKDGTISNTYDIWNFLPNGDIAIDPNYTDAWEKIKYNLNRTMADYQNRFHGAYAPIERASITQYPGGKSIMYLHKWVPAAIINMWQPRMIHSNLGIQEGQVVTLFHVIGTILKDKGALTERFETAYKDMIPKGAIGNKDWDNLSAEEKQKADDKAYEEDPEFRKADGSTDWQKANRDRDTRRLELTNMRRNLVTAVYLMVATAGFMLLKALSEGTDDDNTKRWANFLAKTFDRLRKQQLFAMPVIGLEEEYMLLKSPIASLRTMGQYAEALAATFALPIPPYDANYYTTGVHAGELKAKVKWQKVLPGLNLVSWYKEQTSPTYWVK